MMSIGVLAFAFEAKADCQTWGEWAYDTKCGDSGVEASVTDLIGDTYSVVCVLGPNSCSQQSNGSTQFEWWPVSTCQETGLRVEVNYLTLNGQTGRYDTGLTSEYLGPDSCGEEHYGDRLSLPSYYVLVACRIGYDCT
jgi:hypothetical protein